MGLLGDEATPKEMSPFEVPDAFFRSSKANENIWL